MLENKTKTGVGLPFNGLLNSGIMGLSQANKEAHKRTKEGRDIKPTQNLYIKIKSYRANPISPISQNSRKQK